MLLRETCHVSCRSFPSVGVIGAKSNLNGVGPYPLEAAVQRMAAAGYSRVVLNFAGVRRLGVDSLGAILNICVTASRCGVTLKGE